ncbi:MAG TPA: TolC family protein [Bacteroidia bacterium]|jgi:outer membrane protein|nr:TolC family protein [Bacteroidia bacterium]
MKKTTIAFLLSFISFGTFSQSWNLQQCIDYALKNNLSLKQSQINTDINKVNYNQSKATILPSVNAGGNHTYNMGQTIDRYTNKFANATVLSENFYAQAQVTLWSGMQQYNNVKRNQYTLMSSQETYEQQKNDLALNVATSFLQVVYNTELLKVSEQQVKISQQQLERTQKLADAGATALSAVYDIKAQLATDQYGLVTAQNNYNLALLALKQLLYLDSLNSFTIEKPAFELTAADLAAYQPSDIYQTALKTQHKIKSAEYSLMSAEKNLSYSRGRISPTLSFAGTLGTGYSGLDKTVVSANYTGVQQSTGYYTASGESVVAPVINTVTKNTAWTTQLDNNLNKSLAFTLSVPIFNGLSTYSAVQTAKLQMLNNKYGYDIAKQQLYKTIVQAYADAQGALNKYTSAKVAYETSMQSFTYAEQKFNAGAINSFDYNNSKNRTLKTETDMLNAKYDFIFKLKVLDYYQGKPLTF